MFGWPDLVQNSMQLDCQLASSGIDLRSDAGYDDPRAAQLEGGAAEWMLLLQVDTDDEAGWMWGDCGTLYYWIRRPDLLAGRFDRVLDDLPVLLTGGLRCPAGSIRHQPRFSCWAW